MPNERYVKVSMRERWARVPLDRNGDPAFKWLDVNQDGYPDTALPPVLTIEDVFSPDEVVHLVNRALYGMKYQRETHAARRARVKK